MTLIIQVSVYAGEPVPGADIFIEQEGIPVGSKRIPGNQFKAMTSTGADGGFEFNGLDELPKGTYGLLIKFKKKNKPSTQVKNYLLKFKIVKVEKSGKVVVVSLDILIPSDKLSVDKKFKAASFKVIKNIVFKRNKATGNKGGFAVGGFNAA